MKKQQRCIILEKQELNDIAIDFIRSVGVSHGDFMLNFFLDHIINNDKVTVNLLNIGDES
jgi:hypothetical protein